MPAHHRKDSHVAESDLFQSELLARIQETFQDVPGLAGMALIGSAATGCAD